MNERPPSHESEAIEGADSRFVQQQCRRVSNIGVGRGRPDGSSAN